jgi:hypothetical protein
MAVSPLVEFHCRLHPLPTRSSSTQRLIGWRMATHETRFPTAPSHRSGLRPGGTTMPTADFCRTIKRNYFLFSPGSGTCDRSPAIRLTAFHAQPPNLQPAPLMDMDFAVIGQLVRRRMPYIRFLSIGSRLCSTLPSDPASRRQPLRFAITSPPSGCEEDFHLQAVNHARRTNKTPCPKTGRRYLPKPKLDDLGEDDDQREQHQRFDKRQSKNQRHLDRWTRSWVSCHGFACRSTHPALS